MLEKQLPLSISAIATIDWFAGGGAEGQRSSDNPTVPSRKEICGTYESLKLT